MPGQSRQADVAADAASGTSDGGGVLGTLLSADGFDAQALTEAIENSDLDPFKQQAAKALVGTTVDNPDLIPSVIEQLKTEFGL